MGIGLVAGGCPCGVSHEGRIVSLCPGSSHVQLGSCLPPSILSQSPRPAGQESLASRVGCHLVEPLSTGSSEYPFQGSMCRGACDLRPPYREMTQEQDPRSQGRGCPAGFEGYFGQVLPRASQPSALEPVYTSKAWCWVWLQERLSHHRSRPQHSLVVTVRSCSACTLKISRWPLCL